MRHAPPGARSFTALTRIMRHASSQQDTFYPTLEGAGNTLVVVDFYTDWHAPQKQHTTRPHTLAS
jgi:hypothetical protein